MGDTSWVGYVVSVDCGETLGSFQGHVSTVDPVQQTLSLVKVFKNGLSCEVPEVTISACDIQQLTILKTDKEPPVKSEPTLTKKLNNGVVGKSNTRSPANPQGNTAHSEGIRARSLSQSASDQRRKPGTPRKGDTVRRKWYDQDDDCLNTPIGDYIFKNEFDFEKNLALFDKQAVFEEIDAAVKPDLVRPADERRGETAAAKYKCDETVLKQKPVVHRQIILSKAGKTEFATDTGLIVPSISYELREKLQSTADKLGFSRERQTELFAKAVSEMVIQILGGTRRLNPNNSHQIPSVVILCGLCTQGLYGISCGRHLANHGVNVTCYVLLGSATSSAAYKQEIELYRLTRGKLTSSIEDLPSGPIDAVISALAGHSGLLSEQLSSWYKMAVDWATNCKAPIITIDPPGDGVLVHTKYSLVPILPLDADLSSCGSIYLCDMALPEKVFAKVGINYQSPFGPKSFIPLHPNI
ncbi:enhancer of mRNA decapping [Chamberlinius hualienensis]